MNEYRDTYRDKSRGTLGLQRYTLMQHPCSLVEHP